MAKSRSQELACVGRDPVDLRDRVYRASLAPLAPCLLPPKMLLERLRSNRKNSNFPRNQGSSPTCTGQALASLLDIQRLDRWGDAKDFPSISARMIYQMALRRETENDAAPAGSTLRSAIKGVYNFGACADSAWPFIPEEACGDLDATRSKAARAISLGAYFRVLPYLNDYHCALNETGAILVGASIHGGWISPECESQDVAGRMIQVARINDPDSQDGAQEDGHAFLIVGYTAQGFIVLNSWGSDWGHWDGAPGLALWPYADWALAIRDAWVIRLGVEAPDAFELNIGAQSLAYYGTDREARGSIPVHQLIGHYAHLDDGRFVARGSYPCDLASVAATAKHLRSARSATRTKAPDYHGLLLTLGGAFASLDDAVTLALKQKERVKQHGLYPYTVFWCSDAVASFRRLVASSIETVAVDHPPAGEHFERSVEAALAGLTRAYWRDIETAARSMADNRVLRDILDRFLAVPDLDIHLVCHGEGALALSHWAAAFPPRAKKARNRLFSRLRSVEFVAPIMPDAAFETAFAPFAAAIRQAEAADGIARPIRILNPSAGQQAGARLAPLAGSYLDLMRRCALQAAGDDGLVFAATRRDRLAGIEPVDIAAEVQFVPLPRRQPETIGKPGKRLLIRPEDDLAASALTWRAMANFLPADMQKRADSAKERKHG